MNAVGIGVVVVEDLPARAHRDAGLTFKPVSGSPRCPIYAAIDANRPLTALVPPWCHPPATPPVTRRPFARQAPT